MSNKSVTFITPQYKIAEKLQQPGGKTVAQAVTDAQHGLEGLADACLGAVDEALTDIDRAYKALPDDFDLAALTDLYDSANGLIGIATVAGLMEMDRAAYSLCDLIDRMMAMGRPDKEPIAVHVQALHLLRSPAALIRGGGKVEEVVQGLVRVARKYRQPEPAKPDATA